MRKQIGGCSYSFCWRQTTRKEYELQIYPNGYISKHTKENCTRSGIILKILVENIPERVYIYAMNKIAKYVKTERMKAGLTQEEFALRSGLGLRFVRDLEQGKETVRLDKVNQALRMFGMETVPGEMDREDL